LAIHAAEADLVTVGRIKTVFGVKGWLKVESFTQPIENILDYGEWFIESSQGVTKQVFDDAKVRNKDVVVHFKNVDDREQARGFAQCLIKVHREAMPELQNSDYYWFQLEGLSVYQVADSRGAEARLIGKVDHMLETGANDVLVVKDSANGSEILIPYLRDQVVKQIDLEKKQLLVDWYYD
jgi:16S rRNA processing protein RimM